MRVLITRPEDDAKELALLLAEIGVEPVIFPLLEIEKKPFHIGAPDAYQAVIVTSANSLKSLESSSYRKQLLSCPLYAVGAASAHAARKIGFERVHSADGDLPALKDLLFQDLSPENGPLLYLSGEIISGDMQALLQKGGFQVDRIVLYRAERAASFSPELAQAFVNGEIDGVVLYSKRSAAIFAELFLKTGIQLGGTCHIFCLSEAVAKAFGEAFSGTALHMGFQVKASKAPNQPDILDLIGKSVA